MPEHDKGQKNGHIADDGISRRYRYLIRLLSGMLLLLGMSGLALSLFSAGEGVYWPAFSGSLLLLLSAAAIPVLSGKLMQAEKEKARRYLDIAGVIIISLDNREKVTLVNRKGCEILGLSAEEIIGKNWFDTFIPEKIRAGMREVYKELMSGRVSGGEHVENPVLTAGGAERMIAWYNTLLQDDKGRITGILSSGEDITERNRAEMVAHGLGTFIEGKRTEAEQARINAAIEQAHKMESIGRLAGGIAHDFNNMLSVIIGYSELALNSVEKDHPLYDAIQEIYKAGRRSADLTTQLLGFARKQTIVPRPLDLNDVVGNVLNMLRRMIGEDISLSWVPAEDLDRVYVDPHQIDQILANLCANARDAISGTGKVVIETDNVTLDAAYCTIYSYARPGNYVRLMFSDDGRGMDRGTLSHIFEPFFTTKGKGKGTGLGLATVYGIVKQNNGIINVYSEPGQGTSFKLYFPSYKGAERMERQEKEEHLPLGHGEQVLVVEDEPAILEMAQTMLTNLGYRVMLAGSAREALRVAMAHEGRIDVLLTDMVMPEMDGRELAQGMQELYPLVKIVFMSGYTSSLVAGGGVLQEGVHFLAKPFSLKAVAEKLEEVLREEKG